MYGSASMRTCARSRIVTIAALPPSPLQDIARKILVLHNVSQFLPHISRVDDDVLSLHIWGVKGNLIEQAFHHRMQAPCADVLGALVNRHRDRRNLVDGVIGECHLYALSLQKGAI